MKVSALFLCILAVLCVYAATAITAAPLPGQYSRYTLLQFAAFKQRYNKTYLSDSEESLRLSVFAANLVRVNELNKASPGVYGITLFSDLTTEEFKRTHLNFKPLAGGLSAPVWDGSNVQATPQTFDWRSKGAISKVKDQGQCGSCWAFSATEEIESMWFLAGHPLVELSPQQIVSCDKVDTGCNGGDTPTAYQYVHSAGGIESDATYPYKSGESGADGPCKFDKTKIVASIQGFTYAVPPCNDSCQHQDQDALEAAVATKGPVSVCVYAESWQFYTAGIVTSHCPADYSSLDHCVQVVGYDNTSGKVPYWLVRNSWGQDWGQKGYIFVEKSANNVCGIADEATFVTV